MSDLKDKKVFEKFKAKSVNGEVVRCMKEEDGTVFVFGKGKSRYGRRYIDGLFEKLYTITDGTDPAVLWKRRVNKTLKCLDNSGLWPEFKTVFENLSKMSYEDREEIKRIEGEQRYIDPGTGKYTRRTAEEMEVLWGDYPNKYPFAFGRDEDGELFVKTDYIYEMSDANLKSMYFGKHSNKFVKQCIADAMSEKRKYSSGKYRVSYDVSFSYDPSKNMAWYSEEYKDCGNGYYYVAVDGNTALFLEKD